MNTSLPRASLADIPGMGELASGLNPSDGGRDFSPEQRWCVYGV
ncbi:hypothetical protein SynPROSU1_01875 [Synechococcus sp. PROS-U-1]|nr:hypothetical protein SynPROSU1_01875 [Synechococcus sp. PROS-U-1]